MFIAKLFELTLVVIFSITDPWELHTTILWYVFCDSIQPYDSQEGVSPTTTIIHLLYMCQICHF